MPRNTAEFIVEGRSNGGDKAYTLGLHTSYIHVTKGEPRNENFKHNIMTVIPKIRVFI